jgi:hypothetical protein
MGIGRENEEKRREEKLWGLMESRIIKKKREGLLSFNTQKQNLLGLRKQNTVEGN